MTEFVIVLKTKLKNKTLFNSVCLFKNNKKKTRLIHQLVDESFFGHEQCGYEKVINHINFDRKDNRVTNLEITSQRENTSRNHIISTSKYVGVCYRKDADKWQSRIVIKGKRVSLGFYNNEYDAHVAYQNKLNELTKQELTLKT